MVRERGEGSRNADYAAQSWRILVETAQDHQAIKYGDLSARLGRPVAVGIGVILDHVGCYCIRQGYPPITVLAVNGQTGRPGEGWDRLHPGRDQEITRFRVWHYDWSAHPVPTPGQLADAYRRHRAGARRS